MKNGRKHSILTFVVILALTVLVWGAVAMSEVREYPLKVRVEMYGFDRSRYAVLQADSVVTVQVTSTGFNALLFRMKGNPVILKLNVNGEGIRQYSRLENRDLHICRSVAVNDLGDLLTVQLSALGMRMQGSAKDSLRIVLTERKSKALPVDISEVRTSFAEGYGLYGEPTLSPPTITLFGDDESLSKMDRVKVKPLEIKDLKKSGTYQLTLDTTWHGSDLHVSTDIITLTIPVEQYVERQYEIPLAVDGMDSLVRINLYPDKILLHVWVPRSDIASVSDESFSASVDYRDVVSHANSLKVHLVRFPQKTRLHSLSPEEVKYIVIK